MHMVQRPLTYEELLAKVIDRKDEVHAFEAFLRKETSWATSPASTRFHLAKPGGLVEHSLNVANTLLKMRAMFAPEITEESCVISAIYHDIGKIGWPGKPYYLPQTEEYYRRRGIFYKVNEAATHMDIATRSLHIVGSHIILSEEEAQAIRYHDGQYIEENHSVAHHETKLTRLLQYSDNWSGGVLEGR
ncbi:MAG: HD domain-containing protein [Candidatus Omnitrophica bacterium]|nr:HD domain-containing protein [Candidatus Omnitrophota bacterium]